jgi:hypothetical protein
MDTFTLEVGQVSYLLSRNINIKWTHTDNGQWCQNDLCMAIVDNRLTMLSAPVGSDDLKTRFFNLPRPKTHSSVFVVYDGNKYVVNLDGKLQTIDVKEYSHYNNHSRWSYDVPSIPANAYWLQTLDGHIYSLMDNSYVTAVGKDRPLITVSCNNGVSISSIGRSRWTILLNHICLNNANGNGNGSGNGNGGSSNGNSGDSMCWSSAYDQDLIKLGLATRFDVRDIDEVDTHC